MTQPIGIWYLIRFNYSRGLALRRFLALFTLVSVSVVALFVFIISKPLAKTIVGHSLKMNMARQMSSLYQVEAMDQIIEQLKTLSNQRGVNWTLLDHSGSVLYASSDPVIPNVAKALTKPKISGITDHLFYLARNFEFQNERYILCSGMDKDIAKELIQMFRFAFVTFSCASLGLLAGMQFLGIRLSTYRQNKIRRLMNLFVKKQDETALENLAGYAKDSAVKALLQVQKNRDELAYHQLIGCDEKKTMIDHLEEGVIILDPQGAIKNINLKATKLLHLISIEFEGQLLKNLIESNESKLGMLCLELIARSREMGEVITDDFDNSDKEDSYLEITSVPVRKNKGCILIIRDLSSDHKILSMGKNFVTNASHELRTPITIIKGFTETLKDVPNISPDMLHDITDKILNNCHRMASVVKSLLVLADLDYSQAHKQQACDLIALVESCSYTLLSAYPHVKIETLFNEKESIILGDPDLLELCILNLLENAVKYSKEDPFITITIETLEKKVVLSIRDRGVGIGNKDLKHIFDRFYTVNKSHSRKLGGAGLGLSIVKGIVDKHKGKIFVESEDQQGTEFFLEFPR